MISHLVLSVASFSKSLEIVACFISPWEENLVFRGKRHIMPVWSSRICCKWCLIPFSANDDASKSRSKYILIGILNWSIFPFGVHCIINYMRRLLDSTPMFIPWQPVSQTPGKFLCSKLCMYFSLAHLFTVSNKSGAVVAQCVPADARESKTCLPCQGRHYNPNCLTWNYFNRLCSIFLIRSPWPLQLLSQASTQ